MERFVRQMQIPGFGERAQERLSKSRVLIVGLGGLGSPAAMYLAAAGVGRLGLMDDDTVAASNLNRQILFGVSDLGRPKTEAAAKVLSRINPALDCRLITELFGPNTHPGLLREYDLALDCTDRLETKLCLNDLCLAAGLPFVHAGAAGFGGQLMTVLPGEGPCLRCLLSDEVDGSNLPAGGGIIGPVAGVIGTLQALEAMKYITGIGDLLVGRALQFDGRSGEWSEFTVRCGPECTFHGAAKLKKGASE